MKYVSEFNLLTFDQVSEFKNDETAGVVTGNL